MRSLLLFIAVVVTILSLATGGFSQNCPPGSPYPHPAISSSFVPDSSCRDSSDHSGVPDQRKECLIACELQYATYCTYPDTGSTFSWSILGGTIVSGQNTNCVVVLWGPTGSGTITVTETNSYGCTATEEKCVKIIDSPIAAFSAPTSVCKNVAVYFTNLSQNAVTYTWDFGDGGTSTLVNPTHTYTIAGTYTVTLVAFNKCGCSDSATQVITVDPLSGPVIDCPATVCAFAKECYSTPPACPSAVYNWIVTGGTIIGPSNTSTVCVQWGSGPQGTVALVITGCGNVCPDTTKAVIPIISPTATITGPATVCPGSNTVYTLPLWPGTYYNWTVVGGTIISGWNTNQITVQWPMTPGTYSVNATYNNILLGCGGDAHLTVTVKPEFTLYPTQGPFCLGSTTSFFASTNANWTVTGGTFTGNGTSSISVTWTSTGPQTVTATAIPPGAYCNPTQSMFVNVISPPPAASITGPQTICPGQTYSYNATMVGSGVSLLWTVTGGTIVGSPNANPVTVIWSGSGTISVQQVMTTPPFCPSVPISLPVNVLTIPSITGTSSACMDQTFIYAAGLPNPNIVYTWSIVDLSGNPSPLGSITSGQGTNQVSILWHGPGGNVKIKLVVCGTTIYFPVLINPKPVPTISMTGKVCDPGGSVILTASAGASYLWSTGANTQSIVVSSSGPYSVTVTNAGGCSGTANIVVPHTPGPIASISTPDPTFYCPISPPPTINTTLYALQGPGYTYVWSPGGQTTPTINVTTTGSYFVTVTDANGCSATSNVITVSVGNCIPPPCTTTETINFTINTPVCNPVSFNGFPSGGIVSYSWNFGDPASGGNNTSGLLNPSHTFTMAGYYNVTFSGIDGNGCAVSVTKSVLIPIAAAFSFVNNCGVVTFTDNSTFMPSTPILTWSWSFPGGSPSSSTLQNPPPVTFTSGPHSVSLTITSAGPCSQTITQNVVVAPPPSAAFTLPLTACVGTDINLSGSGGSITNWSWNFGDGATSAIQNTSHAWATAGTYVVTLTVTDASGCTSTVNNSITITSPPTGCTITPSGPLTFCQGGSVTLTASSGSSYQWQLNGVNIVVGGTSQSYSATQTGTYTVIITDPNGCTCTPPPVNVIVNPLPLAIITPDQAPIICGSGIIQLTASAGTGYTYLWSPSGSTGQVEFAVLNTPGSYPYSVTITDANGCTNTATITINVYPSPPPPVITASGPTIFCKGGSVMLTSSSPINNLWSTGATTQSITVSQSGTYTVTVTDPNGCTSSASIVVTATLYPDFSLYPFGCDSLCDTVKIPGPIGNYPGYYTYQWQYNGVDIPPPNGTNDTLTPIGSGQYTLILTGPGPTFCKDTSNAYNLTLHNCDSVCLGRICGRKWHDKNGNHKFNYGTEFGVANWRICLVKCNPEGFPTADTIACTLTDSLGFYCFTNLCAGDYCVVEEHRPGWAQTWPISPPFYHVTITDSQTVQGLDFGNRKKCIDIWITKDTVGVPNVDVLSPLIVYPEPIAYPVRISYSADALVPKEVLFDGFITDNIIALPWWCRHGYYTIKRHHVAGYAFDRVYVNNVLQPGGNVDSVVVELQDSSDGISILFLNTYAPDTTEKYRTFTAEQLAGSDQAKPVKRPKPKSPMRLPNTANVIDEFIRQGCIPQAGLAKRIGLGGKEKGYVMIAKQKDLFVTLNTKGTTHTGTPRGLDFFANGKPILKKQKTMPPTKHNNRLLANLLTLKANICASDMAKTPEGFGDLLYNPVPPYPELGWADNTSEQPNVRMIADIADSLLTKWEGVPYVEHDDLNAVIELLNSAFADSLPIGPEDTLSWVSGGKLALNGVRALSEVPYLMKVTGVSPRIRQLMNYDGNEPDLFTLDQNYPNPFNPSTMIQFNLPEQAVVTLKIYNVLGQEVGTLLNHVMMEDGLQEVRFDAGSLTSGVYFYRLVAESVGDPDEGTPGQTRISMRKMLLMK